jgi:peptide/nickel transport system permease protein
VAIALGVLSARNPLLRAAWRRVGRSRAGMASATVLARLRRRRPARFAALSPAPRAQRRAGRRRSEQQAVYAVEVLSLLDALLSRLRTRNEKTYSEPLATRAHAKETIEVRDADGRFAQSATTRA